MKLLGRLDSGLRELLLEGGAAMSLKGAGAVLGFLLHLCLARSLDPAGMGAFSVALAAATVASVLGRLGLDLTLTKVVAAGAAVEDWPAVRGAFRLAVGLVAGASLGAALALALGAAEPLAGTLLRKPELAWPLLLAAAGVVPLALQRLLGEALKGVRRVVWAQLTESVILPAAALLLFLGPGRQHGVPGALASYLGAAAAAAAGGLWLWRRATPQLRSHPPAPAGKALFPLAWPLFWVSLLAIVLTSASTLLLGAWWPREEVGLFAVANQVATLASLVLQGFNSTLAPRFAALHRLDDREGLAATARRGALLVLLLAGPFCLLCLGAAPQVMGLFGAGFRAGAWPLAILAAGQLVNVGTGSVGFLLMMAGEERLLRNCQAATVAGFLALNVLLVPPFGAVGAAIATAGAVGGGNLANLLAVRIRLGFWTLPLPLPRRRP